MSAASRATRGLVGKLTPNKTAMLFCDIQDKFLPSIHNSQTVTQTSKLLTSVSQTMDIPLIVTEQYPKVFGKTSTNCFEDVAYLDSVPKFEKKLFSMITPEVSSFINNKDELKNVNSFMLFGIEAHVCVLQTALDLLELGHDVHVIVDACSSMKLLDREIALQRMLHAGCYLTTAQSAIFMLMQSADHPNFKTVSKLIKEHASLPNEFNDCLMMNTNDNNN